MGLELAASIAGAIFYSISSFVGRLHGARVCVLRVGRVYRMERRKGAAEMCIRNRGSREQ